MLIKKIAEIVVVRVKFQPMGFKIATFSIDAAVTEVYKRKMKHDKMKFWSVAIFITKFQKEEGRKKENFDS